MILDHALAATSRLGLESLSIGGLADQVGLSKSGLFAHFGSKEELQLQVIEAARALFVERVIAPALTEPRGEPRVRALLRRWLAWSQADDLPGGCVFLAVASELDDRPGPVRDALEASQRDWLDTLATAVRIAVEEGHFRSDVEPRQLAYELYSVYLGYHHFHRLLRDPAAQERAESALESLLARSRAGR